MKNKNILVIEDEEDIQKLISYNLKLENYNVSCEFTGEAGLETAKNKKPDLILLDKPVLRMRGKSFSA